MTNVIDIRHHLTVRHFQRLLDPAASDWTGVDYDAGRNVADLKAILRGLIEGVCPGLKYRLSVRRGCYFAERTFVVWVPIEVKDANKLQMELRRRAAPMNKATPVPMIGEPGYLPRFAFQVGVGHRRLP